MSDPAVTTYTSLQPDQTIGPTHHRFKLLSAGASHPPGQLWRAEDVTTTTPAEVSLLIFDPRQFNEPDQLDRLRTTLNRTKTLKSPHLAPIYGQFFYRGLLFISMPPMSGMSLAQLFDSGRHAKLAEKQCLGIVKQLARALHAVQMARMNHGTLCPELIYLVPGRGVQLLGTGWYNALDSESSDLSYGLYQPEEHLLRGTASTSGDTYALARLTLQLLNSGKLDNSIRPVQFDDTQWSKLNELLTNPTEAKIQAPLQMVRELFSTPDESDLAIETVAIEEESVPASPAAPLKQSASELPQAASSGSVPSVSKAVAKHPKTTAERKFSRPLTRLFNRPIVLAIGFFAGVMVSQLITQLLPSEPLTLPEAVSHEVSAAAPAIVDSVVTMAAADARAINPFAPANLEVMARNHLAIFQHPTPEGVHAPIMVSLPMGRFLMGDIQGVGDDNEKPVREVIVNKRFALSRFEVTFDEYDQFARATERPLPDDRGWGRGNRPVINVSWSDAQAYTQWISSQTGQPYRLPSEAEWEYAARAGTESAYWWGEALQSAMALCDDCQSPQPTDRSAPVGSHPPNPWGLYDLNGNVDEWVADCYLNDYRGATTAQTARTSGNCDQRVMRGGSWFEIGRLVRSSARYRHPPQTSRDSWGFRVAVDLN